MDAKPIALMEHFKELKKVMPVPVIPENGTSFSSSSEHVIPPVGP
jgi:hypothetical protein